MSSDQITGQAEAPKRPRARGAHSFLQRLFRAARLDPWIYRELEYDTGSLWQPVIVVVLASMGTWIGITGRVRPAGMLFFAAAAGVFAWMIWAGIAFAIGVKILPEPQTEATWGELLRTTGFATGPGILAVLGISPSLTGFAPFVTNIWILIAFVVAVRRALDYTKTWRAIVVCAIGWAIYAGTIWALH
jgi:hypothetical protein